MVSTPLLSIDDQALLTALSSLDLTLKRPTVAQRVVFGHFIERAFAQAAHYQSSTRMLRVCYSVKTNPSRSILSCAKRQGLFAEVISMPELDEAVACGFQPKDIVYNGPIPPERPVGAGYIFADSIEAYTGAAHRFPLSCVGARIRPDGIASRFGIPLRDLGDLADAIQRSGRSNTAISFHIRPQDYGHYTFRSLVSAVLDYSQELERRCAAKVTIFDVGGGMTPSEFDASAARGDFDWIERRVRECLPRVDSVFVELGQALVTSSEAVIGSIMEVRRRRNAIEAVLDAGYPDVPQIRSFDHRLFHVRGQQVSRLGRGSDRLLGRTCLEYDVITATCNLKDCHVGDLIAIADAGAYDASMSFTFAQGER